MMMISEWTGAETWIHSFLYARGMTTPPPTCRSALHGLPAATGLCATIRLWAATGLRAVTGLSASTSNWAARWRLQLGSMPMPAIGTAAIGAAATDLPLIVDLVDMVSHSANQQTIEVASHMHTWSSKRNGPFWNVLKIEYVHLEILQYALFGMYLIWNVLKMWFKRNVLDLECAQNVIKTEFALLECVLFGSKLNLPSFECTQNGTCCYWNVLFLEWAVVEWTLRVMCPFWNVIKEKWALLECVQECVQEYVLFGSKLNLTKMECVLFGLCSFCNAVSLECALPWMCWKWNDLQTEFLFRPMRICDLHQYAFMYVKHRCPKHLLVYLAADNQFRDH